MDLPNMTIGMACFDDSQGVWSTVQSMRLYLRDEIQFGDELMVVDNNPGKLSTEGEPTNPHAKSIYNFMKKIVGDFDHATYVPLAEPVGTAAPRDYIFRHALNRYAVCVDSHIFFKPGAIRTLRQYFADHPETPDLISGPLLYDQLNNESTHFADEWSAEMQGTWDRAWHCPCGNFHFTWRVKMPGEPRYLYTTVMGEPISKPNCPSCGRALPMVARTNMAGKELLNAGYTPEWTQPFEIPANGLGFFACRKDAWQGFNPDFRGFGGEEYYIHNKFRLAGAKCICIPQCSWNHRFGHPGGAKYPLIRWDKARNSLLGHLELHQPTERIEAHFAMIFGQENWDYLAQDPLKHIKPKNYKQQQRSLVIGTLDELFDYVKQNKRDLDEHADTVKSIASEAVDIAAFVKRKEWNVLLASGRPKSLTVYQLENDPLLAAVHAAIKTEPSNTERSYRTVIGEGPEHTCDSMKVILDKPVDLLVIDTIMAHERLKAELDRHMSKCSRRILVRGTGAFGKTAEGTGGLGLFYTMYEFIHANPTWFVTYHASHQYGMTLLSRDKQDPKTPLGFGGPGTEMKLILYGYGINPKAGCDCNTKAAQMDEWGPEGCRQNKEQIVTWIKDGKEKWGWGPAFAVGGKLLLSPWFLKRLGPTHPYGALVDESIARAEKRGRI